MSTTHFTDISVLVIGDIMLDQYYVGQVKRISPEAPVPVVHVKNEQKVPGGAANVVNNILGLSATARLIGTAGKDIYKQYLEELFQEKQIEADLIETDYPTITKIRVIGNHQQVVRLDFEEIIDLPEHIERKVKEKYDYYLEKSNIVVLSDYAKGMCSESVCQYVIRQANERKIPVVVDPKGKSWHKYRGAFMVTPNVHEMSDLVGEALANQDEIIEKYGKKVLEEYALSNLLITRSEQGMSLIGADDCVHIPTEAKEVYDVSGAGDTVVATIAVALAAGNSNLEAVRMANKAAGVVVSKFGTAPILEDELLHAMSNEMFSKIVSWPYLQHITGELRSRGKNIVFTNGCFDILHRGHVRYLREAKKQGDILIVGLNSDASVQRLKGQDRPYNKEIDRAEVLAGLESVDYITLFEEDTPYDLIKLVQPDVLVKGGDYKVENIVGREFARTTVVVDFVEGYSTTKMVNQITEQKQEEE